jgi:hypothetical protein
MFIQSIKCSGIEFEQLDFKPDLRVRGLTNLKLLKFNQALKQYLVTIEKVFEVSIWSIMAQIAQFYFWIKNFSFSFLPNRLTILWVLHLFMFFSLCSFQRYIICGFSSYGTIDFIFNFKTRCCSNQEKNQIWLLSILIFNWSPLFADFSYFPFAFKLFLKGFFVQIAPKFAKKFLEA